MEFQKVEFENLSKEQSDSAEQLLILIRRLKSKTSTRLDQITIGDTSLHTAFEPLAKSVDYEDYMELLTDFLALCDLVEAGIYDLDIKKESVRNRFLKRLSEIRSVFKAQNFTDSTSAVLNRHFGENSEAALDDISERFQRGDVTQSSKEDITAAYDVMEQILSMADGADRSERFARLVRHHMNHLRHCLDHYDMVGESEFWSSYKILFATFMQLYPEELQKEESGFKDAMNRAYERMVHATSLPANVATLATVAPLMITVG